jgi:two-component system NtrC family sensor kinase
MSLGTRIILASLSILAVMLGLGTLLIWYRMGVLSWTFHAPMRADVLRTFALVGAWTVLGAAGAVYLAFRRLSRSLAELTAMAQRLGEGHLDQRLEVRSRDEIGRLAATFNQMAASLQSYQDTLEQKVEERTRELDRSQQQLLQAAKLASVGELAGGVAHEINNPAGIILMRASRLAQEAAGEGRLSPEDREDLAVIQRQVEKISRIVAALLAFSRQSMSELRPVDLNGVVRRTASLLEDLIRNRGISLRLELAPSLPPVRADSSRIEQVLLNLTNNALDAMPHGGELSFRTAVAAPGADGERVTVAVADTGCGIPAENLPRIFDPFFTTKDVGQGTGLGLSISYGIVEEHGGTFAVESLPGSGSCFRFALPVLPAAEERLHGA